MNPARRCEVPGHGASAAISTAAIPPIASSTMVYAPPAFCPAACNGNAAAGSADSAPAMHRYFRHAFIIKIARR